MPAASTDPPLSEEELQDLPPPPKPLPKYLSDAALRRTGTGSGLSGSGYQSAPEDVEPRYRRVIGEPEWYRRISIHPHSAGRVSWDTVSMIFLLYNAFIVPLRICFDVTDYCPSSIWIFESVTDWFFVRPPSTPYCSPHPRMISRSPSSCRMQHDGAPSYIFDPHAIRRSPTSSPTSSPP